MTSKHLRIKNPILSKIIQISDQEDPNKGRMHTEIGQFSMEAKIKQPNGEATKINSKEENEVRRMDQMLGSIRLHTMIFFYLLLLAIAAYVEIEERFLSK